MTSPPLIVQSDHTVLLEVHSPAYEEARDVLARFAELEKSPEHVHTYRITSLSLWNAAAAGMTPDRVVEGLQRYARYGVPDNVAVEVHDRMSRYGRVRLETREGALVVCTQDADVMREISRSPLVKPYLLEALDPTTARVDAGLRGHVKQALIRAGYPAEDEAGYVEGGSLAVSLREVTAGGEPLRVRPYQRDAADVFHAGGQARGGSGVIALPCGAGKTIVGLAVMALVQQKTLILSANTVAVRQWQAEIADKTEIDPEDVGEYSGEVKQIRPVTIATYQILTHRRRKKAPFLHLELFRRNDWGLIIYDEVHLLPAPVFRLTAEIQATRRLGLTATLVREDGREEDVFTLIGPRRYDVPWRELERQGWIAQARCVEVRVPLEGREREEYLASAPRDQFRIASENSGKVAAIDHLLQRHATEQTLVIGQYLSQVRLLSAYLKAPLITGQTPTRRRQELYEAFRQGEVRVLVVSRVGNFAIDLPDASVAIQVSGTFGSRQEEAQRLGRILRPKSDGSSAHFYSLVTRGTREQEFAARRQLFLTEQGYTYDIQDWEEVRVRAGGAS